MRPPRSPRQTSVLALSALVLAAALAACGGGSAATGTLGPTGPTGPAASTLAIAAVSPARGPAAGATEVTIEGTGFTATARVRFGGVEAAQVTVESDRRLRARSPAHGAGPVDVEVDDGEGHSDVEPGGFHYDDAPVLASLEPGHLPREGGAVILRGAHFAEGARVLFGGAASEGAARWVSEAQLVATAPAHEPGEVEVTVENPDGQRSTLPAAFRYDADPPPPPPPPADPVLAAVSPAAGPETGGTVVTLTGAAFDAAATVTFDGAQGTVTAAAPASLTVVAPPHAPGPVEVAVANPDGRRAALAAAYTYVAVPAPAPSIATVAPASGPTDGGTTLTVSGAHLDAASATVGGAAALILSSAADAVVLSTPAHAAGAADVVVTNADGQSATAAGAFTFVAPPPPVAIASVAPASGPAAGGTALTIAGAGFAAGATVTVGGAEAAVQSVAEGTIAATTPAHAAGVVSVTVTTPDGRRATLPGAFTYVAPAPPALTAIAPVTGPDLGGTSVTLTGDAFAAGATVTFGGLPAAVTARSATALTVTAPAHPAGAVDVAVRNPDGQQAVLAAGYAYLPPPSVAAVSPPQGSTAGGASLTITGAGFLGATVTIGGAAAPVTSAGTSVLVVTAPAHAAGAVDVVVVNGDGRSATLPGAFTFVAPPAPPPAIAAVGPASGPTAGGTAVTISGTGFDGGATASFGGAPAAVLARSATALSVTAPAHAAGPVEVVVTNGDGQSAAKAGAFTYVAPPPPPPSIASVVPASGPAAGGTVVTLTGAGFQLGASATVGGAAAAVGAVTATGLVLTTPAHAAGAADVVVTNPDGQAATRAAAFTYVAPAPVITAVSPASGPTAGGAAVVIAGTGFAHGATVTMGGAAAAVTAASATSLTVASPAHAAGAVDVVVTNPDGQAAALAAAFTYVAPPPPPALATVAPASGPTAGGTVLTLTGAGFAPGATVTMGGAAATVTAASAGSLTATAPAHAAGPVAITVVNPDGQAATLAGAFTYLAPPPPALAGLSPAEGSTEGGTAVTLLGAGFQAGAAVAFDGVAAVVGAATDTSLTATAPAHAAGPVTVTVVNPDGQAAALAGAFTYVTPPPPVLPAPVLASLLPDAGPAAGGTAVSLSGANFQAGASVSVGGLPAAVTGLSAAVITISTPPCAAGAADVTVTNPDGQAVTLPAAFTCMAPPALLAVAPAAGVTTGGAAVTLTGTGFRAGVTVSFGGAAATVGAVTATTIAVTAPAHAAGAVDVAVTNPDGQAATLAGAFTYALPAPVVAALSPASGPTAGGTAVAVTGSGFVAGATVTVGGIPAAVGVLTATAIAVTTPAHAAGPADVVVTNPDGQAAAAPGGFTYLAPPALASLSPVAGLTTGGAAVTLAGTGFRAGATVTFGGAPAVVTLVTGTSISALAPGHAAGPVAVAVTNPDGQASTLAAAFTYVLPAPSVAAVSPASGPIAGGTAATLTGTGFVAGATVSVGGVPAAVGAVTATAIALTTPTHAAGPAAVTVTNPDGQSATLAGAFSYVAPAPRVAAVSPASGPEAGGTAVTIAGTAFQPGATVTFGGAAATVSSVTATAIAAVTPPHLAGPVAVTVTNPDGQSATVAGGFAFVAPPPPPVLSSVLPSSGTTAGGTAVALSGAAFQAGATVSFGGAAAAVVSVSATAIAVTTPAHAAGAVDVVVTNPDGLSAALPAAFTYAAPPPPPPSLAGLAPVSGPAAGGTSVTLSGGAFQDGATVTFGGVPAAVGAVAAASITVTAPAHAAGAVDVVVTNPDGQQATLAGAFAYLAPPPPPTLAGLSPASGPAAGGTSVLLSGTGFASGAAVTFGGTAAAVGAVTATSLTVTAPAHAAGAVTVTVTNPDGQAAALAGAYTYVAPPPPPAVASATPATGSTAGGTPVVLAGEGFASGATVTFGGEAGTVTGVTATAIAVTAPAHAAGAVDVVVTNPDARASTLAGGFTYVAPPPAPAITALTPNTGPLAGGTPFVVGGTGFVAGATVHVGGAPATVTSHSPTAIAASAPAGVAGPADVTVTNPDGQSATAAGGWLYADPPPAGPPPSITALTPTSGFVIGGTTVTITGKDFDAPDVLFDGVPATVLSSSKTQLVVSTPPHASAPVGVTVVNADGQAATRANGFRYVPLPVLPAPSVTAVTPATGLVAGNQTVVVSGTGFAGGATVTFGGAAAFVVTVTATDLTVVTPPGAAGPADVVVTNVDRQAGRLAGGFTYVLPPPVVTAVGVRGSPQAGGTSQLFVGSGLQNVVSVRFGGVEATGLAYDAVFGNLSCTIPASPLGPAADGFVDLVLVGRDGQTATWPGFHYGNPPAPAAFTPTAAPRDAEVVITGVDFTADTAGPRTGLTVSFGGNPAVVVAKTATQVTVLVPKMNPGQYKIAVTNFDGQVGIAPGFFVAPGP